MDFYEIMLQQKLAGGGGGDVSVESLSVTENGTYTADEGHAYSPVTVSVPNSYTALDEGKVVSNGALVGQTSVTKTANGTYDTTLNDEVVVNVPGVTPTGNINITSTAQTDVSAYATAQVVDADLVAGNIKKDVNILGVTGTYEGGGGSDDRFEQLVTRNIQSAVIPNGITVVGNYAFAGCNKLTSVSLPSSLNVIGTSAFYRCTKLSSITFEPGTYTSYFIVGEDAFRNTTALKSFSLPEGIATFENTNLFNSSGLEEFIFPSTITTISCNIFNSASSLVRIIVNKSTPPTLQYPNYLPSGAIFYVPASAVEDYKAAASWSSVTSRIQAIPE